MHYTVWLYAAAPFRFLFLHLLIEFCHSMSVGGCAVVAFLLASAIPVFSGLLGVIGSVLGSFFCFVLPGTLLPPLLDQLGRELIEMIVIGAMWFFDNWERRAKGDRSRGFIAMCALNGFMVVSGGFLIGMCPHPSIMRLRLRLLSTSQLPEVMDLSQISCNLSKTSLLPSLVPITRSSIGYVVSVLRAITTMCTRLIIF